ncbi:Metallophos-domain-containing protein [Sistotremastrum suecicum HHB10207 ss-3]|uniref:Metallophos-domain-containing protein n=1 Tax=Sistotremastrum suecicum HHB10207 ss-3 TaxID=1314776 RepID=A0A166DUT1_9AGAM|nr:Metallophos-domain-containing protein [Sistotremastrum suecicum HHB10207 ss-3]
MKVAVQGCCHGKLDEIYEQIKSFEEKKDIKVDLLLIGGDFQAIRNQHDLQCMAVPDKYKALGGFHRYYEGEKVAPILTIVIGGNHEASNYMWELYHRGWLAPNIYYLGAAGCVRFNGLRIVGSSGIYNKAHYHIGHFERIPYDRSSIRSIYHTRAYDILKLSLLSTSSLPIDVFMSHDWPNTIEQHGDIERLLKQKPWFRKDLDKGELGSPPLMKLLMSLKPKRWFSAHMHVKFRAVVRHEHDSTDNKQLEEYHTQQKNGSSSEPTKESEFSETQFLALDKCGEYRLSLEILDIEPAIASSHHDGLSYDTDWLAISRALHPNLSLLSTATRLPTPAVLSSKLKKEMKWVVENIGTHKRISDVQQFCRTAPGEGRSENAAWNGQPLWYTNPQTEAFCEMLKIENKVNPPPTEESVLGTPLRKQI